MRLVQSGVVALLCLTTVQCVQTPSPTPELTDTPERAEPTPVDSVRSESGRFVPFARIEGYGNPSTGELWMRQLPLHDEPAEEANGVRRLGQSLAGFCELTIESDMMVGTNPPGTFEFYTQGEVTTDPAEDSSFSVSTCFNRLEPAQRNGEHMAFFGTLGVGCALQHIGNFTSTDFDHVLIDVDIFNGSEAAHGPYLAGLTTGTIETPRGHRNAPQQQRGLWDIGALGAGQSKNMWLFFKNGEPSDFTFKGYLLASRVEDCGVDGNGNSDDEDCDHVDDNGCQAWPLGHACYANDDCETNNCQGANVVSSLGAGGLPLTADTEGTCAPRCGDMVVHQGEFCDDGNMTPGDGCDSLCQIECPRGTVRTGGGGGCFGPRLVSSGASHACAISDFGLLKCWGEGPGVGGGPPQPSAANAPPMRVQPLGARQVVAGPNGNCVISHDGSLRCWGNNANMQARGEAGSDVLPNVQHEPVEPLSVGGGMATVALGQNHTCVLRNDGVVRCWGINDFGQCGQGNTDPRPLAGAADVSLGSPATQLCAGANHSCALLENGEVRCWGENSHGQLGYGNTNNIGDDESVSSVARVEVLSPSEAAARKTVRTVACGSDSTCAILDDGALRCWGENTHGELGYGHTNDIGDNEAPYTAGNIGLGWGAKQVTTARSVTCALLDPGMVKCWGFTGEHPGGCLGHGGTCATNVTTPPASGIDFGATTVTELGTRSGSSTLCARLADGGTTCWSGNPNNACGLDTFENPIDPPSANYTLPPDDVGDTCSDDPDCAGSNRCESGVCVHEGALRVAITWAADIDLDLHVMTPSGFTLDVENPIGYGGMLDFDESGTPGSPHVEHIVFFSHPQEGLYEFWVTGPADSGSSVDFDLHIVEDGTERLIWASAVPAVPPESAHHTFSYPTPIPPLVLGQDTYVTKTSGTSATAMYQPRGVAVDPTTGKIFVADTGNHRVLRFGTYASLTNGHAAEAVLGQPTFDDDTPATSQTGMSSPSGLFVDSAGRLWVADAGNHRVLRFDAASSALDSAAASLVLGQITGTGTGTGNAANRMNSPRGVFVDVSGRLWVADTGNCRVLRFNEASQLADGASAHAVLGQGGFMTGTCVALPNRMSFPMSVFADTSDRLWVADTGNNRILRFDSVGSKANGASADSVLGQATLLTALAATSASGLDGPVGLGATPHGDLITSDSGNHRMLGYDAAATLANGAAADHVLGQMSYDVSTLADPPTDSSFDGPMGITMDPTNFVLWVADTWNNRVIGHMLD